MSVPPLYHHARMMTVTDRLLSSTGHGVSGCGPNRCATGSTEAWGGGGELRACSPSSLDQDVCAHLGLLFACEAALLLAYMLFFPLQNLSRTTR